MRYSTRYVQLHGYFDVDWAGNITDRKSTPGCFFSIGSAMISSMSKKQKSIALRTAEEEYIATSMANSEAIWLRKLFGELLIGLRHYSDILRQKEQDPFRRESCVS